MNQNLKEAIFKQKSRAKFKEMLLKSRINEENLYSVFVEPFGDVIQAAKLATQDIISGVMVVLGTTLLSFSPKLQQKRLDNFDKRYAAIGKEWEPIMQRADEALSGGDADLVAMTFAPGLYAVSALGATAYDAADGVGSYLDNLGLKKGLLAVLPGVSASSEDSPTATTAEIESDESTSLVDKMFMLFLGAAAAGEFLKYQDEQAEKAANAQRKESIEKNSKKILSEAPSGDFISDFREYIKSTGIQGEMKKAQEEIFDSFKDLIDAYDSEVEAKVSVVEAINEAENLEEFIKSLSKIETTGVDLQGAPQKIMDEVEKGSKKLAQSEKFRETADSEFSDGQNPESSMTDQEYVDLAKKSVFADFKKSFQDQSSSKILDMKRELGKDLQQRIPSDKILSMISKTPDGLKLSNLIQDAKSRYINI